MEDGSYEEMALGARIGWCRLDGLCFVPSLASLQVAIISNYPGFFLARWCIHYGGVAPSLWTLWMFDGLLVLTSSLEWVIVGIIARGIARRFSK
jgi:hypothetical protein